MLSRVCLGVGTADWLAVAGIFVGRGSTCIHSSLITEEVAGDRDESHLLALLPHTALTLMEHHRFQVTTSPVHALDGTAVDRFQKSVSSPASVLLNSFVAVREHVKGFREKHLWLRGRKTPWIKVLFLRLANKFAKIPSISENTFAHARMGLIGRFYGTQSCWWTEQYLDR